jgi:hypothetical protein
MNWTQFLLSLSAIYITYYLFNILFDLLRSKSDQQNGSGPEELTFYEGNVPEPVFEEQQVIEETKLPAPKNRQAISSGKLQSTGGVNLKQLFSLAQSDLIEYTKAIPY